MDAPTRRRSLTYLQTRILLVLLGAGLAAGQTLVSWERGAPPTEVLAQSLAILLFAGAVFWHLTGGLVGAGAASLVYLVLLVDQSAAIGVRAFTGLAIGRVFTYLFYGVIVALGARYVETRLRKL